jgi:hypothetical protein
MEQYFPNYPASDGTYHFPIPEYRTGDARSILQPLFEICFSGKLGDKLDEFLRLWTQKHLNKKFSDHANRKQKQKLVLKPNVSKFHEASAHDHKTSILDKYHALLRQYHIFNLKEPESVALENI